MRKKATWRPVIVFFVLAAFAAAWPLGPGSAPGVGAEVVGAGVLGAEVVGERVGANEGGAVVFV